MNYITIKKYVKIHKVTLWDLYEIIQHATVKENEGWIQNLFNHDFASPSLKGKYIEINHRIV